MAGWEDTISDIPKEASPAKEESKQPSSWEHTISDIQEPSVAGQTADDIMVKLANGGAFGMLPYIAGGIGAAGRVAGVKGLGNAMKDIDWSGIGSEATIDPSELGQEFEAGYDKEKALQDDTAHRSPWISAGAELTGGLATGSYLSNAAKLGKIPEIFAPFGEASNMTKMGTMDFATQLPKADLLSRIGMGIANNAPTATALGLLQPTKELGWNPEERLTNAAVANVLSVPATVAVEGIPSLASATKENVIDPIKNRVVSAAGKVADLIPDRTKAAYMQGVEGYWLKGKKIQDKISQLTNQIVKSFEDPVQQIKAQRDLQADEKLGILRQQLDDLDTQAQQRIEEFNIQKKRYTDSQSEYHSNQVKENLANGQAELDKKLNDLNAQKEEIMELYKQHMEGLIEDTQRQLDAATDLKTNYLDTEYPENLASGYQDSILADKSGVGKVFNKLDDFSIKKKFNYDLSPSLNKFAEKLKNLELWNSKIFQDKEVRDIVQEIQKKKGKFTAQDLRSFINGSTDGDVKAASGITRFKDAVYKTKDSNWNTVNRLIEDLRSDIRAQQIQQLRDAGYSKQADLLQSANDAWANLVPRFEYVEKNPLTGLPYDKNTLVTKFKKLQKFNADNPEAQVPEIIDEIAGAPELNKNINEFLTEPLGYAEASRLNAGEVQRLKRVLKAAQGKAKTNPEANIYSPVARQTMIEVGEINPGIEETKSLLERLKAGDYSVLDKDRQNKIEESEKILKSLRTGENLGIRDIDKAKYDYVRQNTGEVSGIKQQIRGIENPKIKNTLDKLVSKTDNPEELQKEIYNIVVQGADTSTPSGAGTAVDRLTKLIGDIETEIGTNPANKEELKSLVDKIKLYEQDLYGVLGFGNITKGKAAMSTGMFASLSDRAANLAGKMTPKSVLEPKFDVLKRLENYKKVNSLLSNLGTTLGEIKNADSVKRAAVLNSLMQNPGVREQIDPEELKKILGAD